jgi:hypothetical protein
MKIILHQNQIGSFGDIFEKTNFTIMAQQLKSYELMDENELTIEQLPEKIQGKFEKLDSYLQNLDECESEKEANDIAQQIIACDTGIVADLESFIDQEIEKMKKEDLELELQKEKENPNDDLEKASQGATIEDNTNTSSEGKPAWRFWM